MKLKLLALAAALAAIALTAQTNNETANRHGASPAPPTELRELTDLPLMDTNWIRKEEWKPDTNWQNVIVNVGGNVQYYLSKSGKLLQLGLNGVSNHFVYTRTSEGEILTNQTKTTNWDLTEPLPTRWVQADLATNKDGSVRIVGLKP